MITYQVFNTSDDIEYACDAILEYKIHFKTSESGIKDNCIYGVHSTNMVVIAWDGEVPIGTAIYTSDYCSYNLLVYVQSKYRRRGIGSKLINKVVLRSDKPVSFFRVCTLHYRKYFYKKLGLCS